MAYSYSTFAQAKAALAQRLNDPGMQFFSDAELGSYICESLQAFNAFGNYYRQEFVFNSRAGISWYDLTDTTNIPNTLRPFTVTDQDILSMIEYHLLEPQTPAYPLTWTGSLQFNVTDILNAIQQIRDQVISESNCTITQSMVPALPGRTFLSDVMLGLRRVTWIPVTGFGYLPNNLRPSDLYGQQAFEPGFPQASAGIPLTYRLSTEPPLGFDVDVQPGVPGQWDILTVNAGANLSSSVARVLPIPNDWCWVVKWGALAQLFGRDSVAADPLRAQYCTMRFKEGITAMKGAPALLGARLNDQTVSISSITAADFYDANWQAKTPGSPSSIYYAGLNMLALSPQPVSTGNSVTASVVRNMILPSLDSDFIQVGKDDLAGVLDESQHIGMLKCGGSEFAQTFPLHSNFLRRCMLSNAKLSALSQYLEFLDGRAQADQQLHPSFQGSDSIMAKG